MQEGIELYNEQKYWECHEVFEDLWREDLHDPIRYIYWAVIQVAAACIHYRDKNLIGAQGMIAKAKEKFKHCRDSHILSELAYDKLQWDKFEELAMKIPDSSTSKLEDFREIFDFRFP
jgi:predicted metal-dependent hydrolase